MYDQELLGEKLRQISDALARIARRFENIQSADDFLVVLNKRPFSYPHFNTVKF